MRAARRVLRASAAFSVALPVTLGACAVAPPTGPTVMVLPGHGKDLAAFQQDDTTCRGYAEQRIGGASPAAAGAQSGVASAVVGTGLGAAAGAAIGSASGEAGAGAAIGAASGLLFGSLFGAQNAWAGSAGLQSRYDMAYVQCMAAKGDQVPPAGSMYPGYSAYPYYPSYPGYYPGYPYYYFGWGG
jgi:Glycine-zipper domain